MKRVGFVAGPTAGLLLLAAWAWDGTEAPRDPTMVRGPVELASIGPLTFSPSGTLFIGDSYGAQVFAVDLEEEEARRGASINVEGIDARVASLLGTSRERVRVHDVADHSLTVRFSFPNNSILLFAQRENCV